MRPENPLKDQRDKGRKSLVYLQEKFVEIKKKELDNQSNSYSSKTFEWGEGHGCALIHANISLK